MDLSAGLNFLFRRGLGFFLETLGLVSTLTLLDFFCLGLFATVLLLTFLAERFFLTFARFRATLIGS